MFREILQKTQTELYDYLIDKLKEKGYNNIITTAGKYEFIAAKGTIPIVLVAHLDTVFKEGNRSQMLIYHDSEQGVWWSPNGLGADDRAGVYMILQILEQTNLRPHILFTTDEESKATGASAVCGKKDDLFGDISYIIELDRQGYRECVFYECDNPEFEKFIEGFGFTTQSGTFTDISIICPDWEVAGVNLSVGYIYEHSRIEHFYEAMWKDTYKKVVKMLETKCDRVWKYIPKEYDTQSDIYEKLMKIYNNSQKEKKSNGKGSKRQSSSGK